MIYTNEHIQEKFRELPLDLQKTITSVHSAEAIQVIGKNNALLIDKIGILGYETGLALIGITPLSQFPQIISEKLSISLEKASHISEEINDEIFLKIRAVMQQKQEEEDSDTDTDTAHSLTKVTVQHNTGHTDTEETPSRESVLAGIEDPKSINLPRPTHTLPQPSVAIPTPLARTVLATNGLLEKKLQTIVHSENPAPKYIIDQRPSSGITQITKDPYREAIN